MRDSTYKAAVSAYGIRTHKSNDWFDAYSAELLSLIEAKRKALTDYTSCKNERTLNALRAARNTAQHTAKCCANKYW